MDSKSLGKLIDLHFAPLELYARQWCEDPADIVQAAFLKLIEEPESPSNIRAWLYTVVRNLAISSLRSESRRRQRETAHGEAVENWFEEQSSLGLDGESATQALKELPDEIREVVVAHLWGEMTFEEIGELTLTSSSTAHRRYVDGINQLKTIMGVTCQTLQ